VTAAQQAVSAATVAISAGPPHPDIAAVTDNQGAFFLSGLAPGSYQLTVNKAGYRPQTVTGDPSTDRPVTVVLREPS